MTAKMQKITVIVEGQEFLVEVGDLDSNPVIAVVDGRTYQVVIGPESKSEAAETPTPFEKPVVSQQPVRKHEVSSPSDNVIVAPMPGDITEIKVVPGQQVAIGNPLCVLDAMKMKNVIYSPRAGRIASVEVHAGQAVEYGTILVRFE